MNRDVIDQFVQAAEFGRSDFFQIKWDIKGMEYFVQSLFITQILGNGNLECLLLTLFPAKVKSAQYKHQHTQDNGEQNGVTKGTYTAGQTGCHGEQNVSNVFRITGCAAETDNREGSRQAEGPGNVTTDQQDDDGNDHGKHNHSQRKTL
ncbi:hypothetical protein D3C74_346630 [compost metagenome]